jgi:hypothetical protein
MMNTPIYLIIAFVIFFIMWKKREEEINEADAWLESSAFWTVVLTSGLWPLFLPLKLMWALMELIYNKFTKTKTKE